MNWKKYMKRIVPMLLAMVMLAACSDKGEEAALRDLIDSADSALEQYDAGDTIDSDTIEELQYDIRALKEHMGGSDEFDEMSDALLEIEGAITEDDDGDIEIDGETIRDNLSVVKNYYENQYGEPNDDDDSDDDSDLDDDGGDDLVEDTVDSYEIDMETTDSTTLAQIVYDAIELTNNREWMEYAPDVEWIESKEESSYGTRWGGRFLYMGYTQGGQMVPMMVADLDKGRKIIIKYDGLRDTTELDGKSEETAESWNRKKLTLFAYISMLCTSEAGDFYDAYTRFESAGESLDELEDGHAYYWDLGSVRIWMGKEYFSVKKPESDENEG